MKTQFFKITLIFSSIFLFTLIHLPAQINPSLYQDHEMYPRILRKVYKHRDWYAKKGLDISNYDWSDYELNILLGDVEGQQMRRKMFNLMGYAHLGISSIYFLVGMTYSDPECRDGAGAFCFSTESDVISASFLGSAVSLGVSIPFLLVGNKERRKRDLTLARAKERYFQLGGNR